MSSSSRVRRARRDGILERLKRDVVLGDGGYILELERRGYVQAGPYTPEVSIEHPEALRQLHREFARAGSEVLQALTFYASRDKLATAGSGDGNRGPWPPGPLDEQVVDLMDHGRIDPGGVRLISRGGFAARSDAAGIPTRGVAREGLAWPAR